MDKNTDISRLLKGGAGRAKLIQAERKRLAELDRQGSDLIQRLWADIDHPRRVRRPSFRQELLAWL